MFNPDIERAPVAAHPDHTLFMGIVQTNPSGPAKVAGLKRSGRQLTPLGQGGSAVLLENVAGVEVAVVVEVVVDRSMFGREFLQG
jgi:hypothetical protein